ncbi:MAG: rod-binding protein [Rhodospirillales bacterium]|nr:rod-binding protein [Rhodospirillales bacterium]
MTSAMALQASTAMHAGTGKVPNLAKSNDPARIREVAQEFEAVFLAQMLQPMFAGLGAEKPFGGGMAEDMWRSMLAEEYGKSIAAAGGVGIADEVAREMLKMQELEQGLLP